MITVDKANLTGAIVGVSYYAICIFIFAFRLAGHSQYGHWIGHAQFLAIVPLSYLLVVAPRFDRAPLYYLQIILLLIFVIAELLLDYILKVDFRHLRCAVIPYVMMFFAATGGMLGVVALCGRAWSTASIILFLCMAILAFVQRRITGM